MPGSAKPGNGLRSSRRAESPAAASWLTISCGNISRSSIPKSATPDLLEEIANIKHRIERDVVGPEKLERDVKLGRGGIRDIEFIVQTLQLIHGARNPFLQEPSMLKALRALRELDLAPAR